METTIKEKIEKVREVIILTEKKVRLLKELEQSLLYGYAIYILHKNEAHPNDYFLIHKETKAMVFSGTQHKTIQWLERNKVPMDQVYSNQLIQK